MFKLNVARIPLVCVDDFNVLGENGRTLKKKDKIEI